MRANFKKIWKNIKHNREVFTAEKCKRDWPIGGKAASAATCVCVRIAKPRTDWRTKYVRIGKYSSKKVFESRGTIVYSNKT